MTHYCSSCGKKNIETDGSKPKFCSGCGEPLDAAFKVAKPAANITKPIIAKKVRKEVEEEYEDEGFAGEIIIPKAGDIEYVSAARMTIGDLSRMANPLREMSNQINLPADIEVRQSKNTSENID